MAMGTTGISKNQVSRLCEENDERVNAFRDRPLEGDWLYLLIDATYVKVRQGGRIVSVATIIAVAVNADGRREVLAICSRVREVDGGFTTTGSSTNTSSQDGIARMLTYQLIHNGNVHALRADFDADCIEISPGTHLFRHLLQSLFGQGQRCYFMGPEDNACIARWTDEGDPLCKIAIFNRTSRGRLSRWWEVKLKPAARALCDHLAKGKAP